MTDETVINGSTADHLHEPVVRYARGDFPIIRNTLTVGEALGVIRCVGVGERIIYFYVIDDGGRLVGIVPTRRLLTSAQEVMIGDIMVTNVITLPEEATVFEALELFVKKKLLAFPIVNQEGQMVGVIDIGFFSDEQVSIVERQHIEDIFQLIGFGMEQLKGRSVFGVFRYRFPWLLATIMSGTTCALLAGYYQTTLAETIVLAFFLTLVLGLGESVSIQSMTMALQKLHFGRPSLANYLSSLRSELSATALLGLVCGGAVGSFAWLWRGETGPALVISLSIFLAIVAAGVIGLSIPTLLHAMREDSKIAAGPITLALADIMTLLFYLNAARWLL
ncbi:MAG TPA: magnesium transporter [Pyrinomonadaceae bacterium]|nr:magnesium transporter [Pyrinomonadaceae bacterium]